MLSTRTGAWSTMEWKMYAIGTMSGDVWARHLHRGSTRRCLSQEMELSNMAAVLATCCSNDRVPMHAYLLFNGLVPTHAHHLQQSNMLLQCHPGICHTHIEPYSCCVEGCLEAPAARMRVAPQVRPARCCLG